MTDKPTFPTSDYWQDWDWEEVFAPTFGFNEAVPGGLPVEPVVRSDVAEVIAFWAESPEGYASTEFVGRLRLHDGRHALVEAWCDTTGWDCQSSVAWAVGSPGQVDAWITPDQERRLGRGVR